MQKYRRRLSFFAAVILVSPLFFPHSIFAQSVEDVHLDTLRHDGPVTDSQQTIISPLPDSALENKEILKPVGTDVSAIISPLATDAWTEEILIPEPAPDVASLSLWGRFKYSLRNLYYKIFPGAKPVTHRLIFHRATPKPVLAKVGRSQKLTTTGGGVSDFSDTENLITDDPNCDLVHNSDKIYTVGTAAQFLVGELTTPQDLEKLKNSDGKDWRAYENAQVRFKCKDAQNTYLPEKARDMYERSANWDPKIYPENYVECVTLVAMAYNMAGISLPRGLGDAKDWIDHTEVFDRFKSGESTEPPKIGDVMVWEDGQHGHVGVVTELHKNYEQYVIKVVGSNTPEIEYSYNLIKNKTGKLEIVSDKSWKPDFWLRKRN